jgi:hypothetical protein
MGRLVLYIVVSTTPPRRETSIPDGSQYHHQASREASFTDPVIKALVYS